MRIAHKVYGALGPAEPELGERLRRELAVARRAGFCPEAEPEEIAALRGGALHFSYEGLAFPLEAVLEALRGEPLTGRLDFLDLEAWTLTRHSWENGRLSVRSGSLNAVLEQKGF